MILSTVTALAMLWLTLFLSMAVVHGLSLRILGLVSAMSSKNKVARIISVASIYLHEIMHAVMATAFFHRVTSLKVGFADGKVHGSMSTLYRPNIWTHMGVGMIAMAPVFLPIILIALMIYHLPMPFLSSVPIVAPLLSLVIAGAALSRQDLKAALQGAIHSSGFIACIGIIADTQLLVLSIMMATVFIITSSITTYCIMSLLWYLLVGSLKQPDFTFNENEASND